MTKRPRSKLLKYGFLLLALYLFLVPSLLVLVPAQVALPAEPVEPAAANSISLVGKNISYVFSPKTLGSSGWVYLNLTGGYTGYIDAMFGFSANDTKVAISHAQEWDGKHWVAMYGLDPLRLKINYGKSSDWSRFEKLKYVMSVQKYVMRFWVEIPFYPHGYSGEYYFAVKPSALPVDVAIFKNDFYAIDPWWDASWGKAIRLTLNNAGTTENQTDYPVMAFLNSTRINWADVQDSLADFRFIDYDNSTTPFSAELEKNNVNVNATCWFKVPHTRNYVFLYYDNPLASPLWDAENVWNSDYWLVQHFNMTTGTNGIDSTGHGNTVIPVNSPPQVNSKVDGSWNMSGSGINDPNEKYAYMAGSNPYQNIAGSSAIELLFYNYGILDGYGAGSELVFKQEDYSRHYSVAIMDDYYSWQDHLEIYYYLRDSGGTLHQCVDYSSLGVLSNPSTWHGWTYLVCQYNGTYMNIFINGTKTASSNVGSFSIMTANDYSPLYLGTFVSGGGGARYLYQTGMDDEFRLYNAAESPDYIKIQDRVLTDIYITYGTPVIPILVQIENKSVSSSSYSISPNVFWNLSAYVAETGTPNWKLITNVTLFLQPSEESFILRAFNNSGTWAFSLSDPYHNGDLNSTLCSAIGINASTVKVNFGFKLYQNFTYSGITVNMTSATQTYSSHSNTIFHDAFVFNKPSPPTLLIIMIAAVVSFVGIILYVKMRNRK